MAALRAAPEQENEQRETGLSPAEGQISAGLQTAAIGLRALHHSRHLLLCHLGPEVEICHSSNWK